MPENPNLAGPVKSLRQVPPGGDIIAGVFALIAAYVLLSLVSSRPDNALTWIISLAFVTAFGLPAYVLFASARGTGVFVTDDRVEYRRLNQSVQSWPRTEVQAIEAMSGGLKVQGKDGHTLREIRFRWWNTDLVARFARAVDLAPVSPGLAALSAQVDPGEPGQA